MPAPFDVTKPPTTMRRKVAAATIHAIRCTQGTGATTPLNPESAPELALGITIGRPAGA
ncbi:MAG: hypothetical protein WCO97_10850 [bacterium]